MMASKTNFIPMSEQVDFSNTKIAFAGRSDRELRWSSLLFTMMNIAPLVRLGSRAANWALQLNLPVEGLVKRTIYQQFCGGETIEEAQHVIHKLGESGIKTILDYGVEAKATEADFEKTARQLIQTIEFAQGDAHIHIVSTKLSGLLRFALLEKVSAREKLTGPENAEFERGLERVDRICRAASDAGVSIHVDAEHSWIQPAIDQVAWRMSRVYNQSRPVVINAVQLYLKGRLEFLRDSLDDALAHGYLCAVKLVRGAYMEKERARAYAHGYASPVHETLAETHQAYNLGLEFCIEHLGEIYVCNATHNEESCRRQIELMEARGLSPGHHLIATAQLYGMSDNLSYNMANAGYQVEKYLPYGPVREVIPYLIRRTQENTSVGGQMSRELRLIKQELRRRRG